MNDKGRDDAIHGETEQVEAVALLPAEAVRDLTIRAAQRGVPAPQFLGIQALRGAYGALHPDVVAFEKRAIQGQEGPGEV